MLRRITFLIVFLAMILMMPKISEAQIIQSTGNFNEASSQLISPYNVASTSLLQITNTNDVEGVWIHIQIFRSYDIQDNADGVDLVICDERDFVDFLTPNDTHVYSLETSNFNRNIGETAVDPGDDTTIDLFVPQDTLGFVVVTPVVSDVDFTAISFQNLIGNYEGNNSSWFNIMGRDALDFATGQVVPDGTPLDGVTNGFVVLQPAELILHLPDDSDINYSGISFIDNYGPPGLLGYTITPGEVLLTSFVFDYRENPTSCGNKPLACFINIGLEATNFDQDDDALGDDDFLCGGIEVPEVLDGGAGTGEFPVWVRSFVSGYDAFENALVALETNLSSPTGDSMTWLDTK